MIRSIFATIIFVAVTIVLSIVSIPAALFDRSGSGYLWFARIWSKIFLALFGIKLHVTGLENIKHNEHYVFVANHSSYTDIPIILAAIPTDIRLILRSTLTRIPIWGWALLASPMIIIDRSNAATSKKSLADAIEVIRRGASVLLFPEGTRTPNGELQSFKRGAFHMACQSGAKIIPVVIQGSFEVMPRTANLPISNKKVSLKVGIPIEISWKIDNERAREMDIMVRSEEAAREMLS